MNVLVIGGSGLLGTHTVEEACKRGHSVSVLSRGNVSLAKGLEGKVRQLTGDVSLLSTKELVELISGHEAVVYALGLDDRHAHKRPAYAEFHGDHVSQCKKVLASAREAGAKKFVVFGSYFTYFDKHFPALELASNHIYIKTRSEQRDMVLEANYPTFQTFVLELPYIFGSLPGNLPPWTLFFSMLAGKSKSALFFRSGGTAAVSARQVGQAALGAIEQGSGGHAYALGGCNLKWTDIAQAYFDVSGKTKKIIGLPPLLFKIFGFFSAGLEFLQGKERGLSIAAFTEFQYLEAYVDPEPAMKALGYPHDDYKEALAHVIRAWNHKQASNLQA